MLKVSWGAGHAGFGVTSGKRTIDGSMYEWDFNSAVVKYAMAELANYKDVAQLRVDDPTGKRDIPLQERSDRVNAWGANVHIDVHANAYGTTWNDARGIETYIYEFSLAESHTLANAVQSSLIFATGLRNRGVKKANFHILREVKAKARILVECGFMTNRNEAELLKNDSYRKLVAKAIVSAIADVYKLQRLKQDVVYWDGSPMRKGQIGRLTVLKPINLWKRDENDKLHFVRILEPGERYRVYGYDTKYFGQYAVGGDHWITNMAGYVLYETPSKTKLKALNG